MRSEVRSCGLEIASTWDGHPLPPEAISHVSLELDESGLSITVDAPFYGDPPPVESAGTQEPVPVGSTWKLWEHEVVEVFIAGPGERYTEIEIGPWGHYLVLRLDGVRNVVARTDTLDVTVTREAGRWRAVARLGAASLPQRPHTVNAYAIHGLGEGRSYSAAYTSETAPRAPDFHRLETFRPWTEAGSSG